MIIDLSVPLNEQTPVYPGDPKTNIKPAGVFAKDRYNDHYVSFGTHVGTHIDAPLHMIDKGHKLHELPIEQFIGRGRYVKVEDSYNLDAVKRAVIAKDDIVLFHTGKSDSYYSPNYFEDYLI